MTQTRNTILLAGFEPFGEFTVNPSALVVEHLNGESIGNDTVSGIVLPVVFGTAWESLLAAIETSHPVAVICLGLAAERPHITLERLAVNLDDAGIADNQGNQPEDQPIIPDGPSACWSTLPVKALVKSLQENGIEASLSMNAGTYVCNHVFYHLLHYLRDKPAVKGGFIHLPMLTDTNQSSQGMTLEAMKAAIITVLNNLDEVSDQPAPETGSS